MTSLRSVQDRKVVPKGHQSKGLDAGFWDTLAILLQRFENLPARIWSDFVTRAGTVSVQERKMDSVVISPRAQAGQGNPLQGAARVIDTSTLVVAGERIQLNGVRGAGGRLARQLARYLGDQQIACEPAEQRTHRCKLGENDLAELILAGVGARAAENAPLQLLTAEEYARSARLGIWRR